MTGALALIAASTLVFGIEAWAGYLDAVRWFSAQAENQPTGTFFDYSSSVLMAPFAGAHLNALQIPLVPVAHLAFFGYILVRLRAGLTAVKPPQRMPG